MWERRRRRRRRERLTRTETRRAGRLDDPAAHPALRFGVGLRRVHFREILGGVPLPGLDFLEVVPENFMEFGGLARRVLALAGTRVPLVTHGIGLSLGSPDPLDETYLARLAAFVSEVESPWHSDHLSVSSAHGVEYHDLLPAPLGADVLARMIPRIRRAQEVLGRPLLIENPTVYTRLPGGDLPEPEFLARLVEETGCGLLLDLNNLWVNCRNHGGDPFAYLEVLPAGAVRQIHLAGHRVGEPLTVDTHGAPVAGPVRELYAWALRRLGPAWTVLERDSDVPPLEELLEELAGLRELAHRALAAPSWTTTLPVSEAPPPPPPRPADEVQDVLHRVALGALDAAEGARDLGVPEEGLRLYAAFFRRHHREILATPFRFLFSLLDPALAEELAQGYQRDHPMAHREINANAEAFPGWLEARVDEGEPRLTGFHVELAVLERLRFRSYSDPVEIPVLEEGAAPVLNPTAVAVELAWPVADWIDAAARARDAGDAMPPAPMAPRESPEHLLVYRDPRTLLGRVCRATPRLLFAVKMLAEAVPPEDAAALAGVEVGFAREALAAAVAQGLAVDHEARPPGPDSNAFA